MTPRESAAAVLRAKRIEKAARASTKAFAKWFAQTGASNRPFDALVVRMNALRDALEARP